MVRSRLRISKVDPYVTKKHTQSIQRNNSVSLLRKTKKNILFEYKDEKPSRQ